MKLSRFNALICHTDDWKHGKKLNTTFVQN